MSTRLENVEVTLQAIARSEAGVLANLFELYVYDFSEYMSLTLKESGRYELLLGESWWDAPTHHPFFIRVGGRLAGFALARQGSELSERRDVMDVAEFFVLRSERRKHVGMRAALALMNALGSDWEIRVRTANAPAVAFWARVAERYAGAPCEARHVMHKDAELTVLDVRRAASMAEQDGGADGESEARCARCSTGIDWGALQREFGNSGGKEVARVALARILGDAEVTAAVQRYIAGCKGSEVIFSVLRMLKPEAARAECLRTVRKSDDRGARSAAAELFRVVAKAESLPVITEFLAHEDPDVQAAGASAVDYLFMDYECREPDVLGATLAEMSRHGNPQVSDIAKSVERMLSEEDDRSDPSG